MTINKNVWKNIIQFLITVQAARYAEGGAESSEYCDEKLDDVLPNVFVDSHSGINLMYNL